MNIINKFKDDYIFQLYKDKPMFAQQLKKEVKEKFNITVSSDLYSRITNYQIKKYGIKLDKGTQIEYIRPSSLISAKRRRRNVELNNEIWQLQKLYERTDKR